MIEYISHFSASKIWNVPCIEAVLGNTSTGTDTTHVTVSRHNMYSSNNRNEIHSCTLALPDGAVLTQNGRAVASPELMFLELSNELSIHRLILLGLQLCSHPHGCPAEAITTKQKLNGFIVKACGHRGRRKAMRAVKYVENGSSSIMESLAYMILTLPHALGGYGLNGVVFNYKVELKGGTGKHLQQNRCFIDLYYKEAKVAVEYDSFAFHNSPREQGRDAMRSAILEKHGVDVMHMNTIQLYNREACRDFADNLAAHLGKRMQIRSKKFDEMHMLIRELLPSLTPPSP